MQQLKVVTSADDMPKKFTYSTPNGRRRYDRAETNNRNNKKSDLARSPVNSPVPLLPVIQMKGSVSTQSSTSSLKPSYWKDSYTDLVKVKTMREPDGLALLAEDNSQVKLGYIDPYTIPCKCKGINKTDVRYKYLSSMCNCAKCQSLNKSPNRSRHGSPKSKRHSKSNSTLQTCYSNNNYNLTPDQVRYLSFTSASPLSTTFASTNSSRPYTAPNPLIDSSFMEYPPHDEFDEEIVKISPFTSFPICKGMPIHEKVGTPASIRMKPFDSKNVVTYKRREVSPYSLKSPTTTTIISTDRKRKGSQVMAIEWVYGKEHDLEDSNSQNNVQLEPITSASTLPPPVPEDVHDPNNFTVLAIDAFTVETTRTPDDDLSAYDMIKLFEAEKEWWIQVNNFLTPS